MKRETLPISHAAGSAILIVMITVAVLAFIAAGMIRLVGDRHRAAFESGSWNESVLAAEAGADLAVKALRWTLAERAQWTDQTNALSSAGPTWGTNWGTPIDQNGAAVGSPLSATGSNSSAGVVVARWYRPTEPLMQHAGEGSTRLFTNVIVDAPASLRQSSGLQWYRIRSTGMVNLPFRRASADRHDNDLRQLSLVWDRNSLFVPPPFASRLIEVVVKPVSAFTKALVTEVSAHVPGSAGVVDSFDSRDPLKSTSGQYDPAKRQSNGTVATNGTVFTIDGIIYGDASTNGGSLAPSANVTGTVRNDVHTDLQPVAAPTWTASGGTPTTVTGASTVNAGTAGSPVRVKLNKISGSLTLAPGAGGFVDVWVTGNITGSITVQAGVQARIWFEGNVSVGAGDIDNQTNRAANLEFFGVNPPSGQSRSIDISPSGNFICAIYAPGHDLNVNGNPDLIGSFVTRTIDVNGNCSVHYDESLADDPGVISDFKVASWLEDVR